MKVGFLGILVLMICSCAKKEATPYSSLQETKWNWISTTQDSTFYEDTASSTNSQFLYFMDYRSMEWKRNDSVFFNGVFRTSTKASVLTGKNQLIMDLDGSQMAYVIVQLNDTLWLREDIASGSRTFRYLKTN
jgi:hypothetical protein